MGRLVALVILILLVFGGYLYYLYTKYEQDKLRRDLEARMKAYIDRAKNRFGESFDAEKFAKTNPQMVFWQEQLNDFNKL